MGIQWSKVLITIGIILYIFAVIISVSISSAHNYYSISEFCMFDNDKTCIYRALDFEEQGWQDTIANPSGLRTYRGVKVGDTADVLRRYNLNHFQIESGPTDKSIQALVHDSINGTYQSTFSVRFICAQEGPGCWPSKNVDNPNNEYVLSFEVQNGIIQKISISYRQFEK